MSSSIHVLAEKLREQEKFTEALAAYAQAIKDYFSSDDFAGVADALGGQSLTYKHIFLLNPIDSNLELCRGSAYASLKIAQQHNLSLLYPRCYLNLGEADLLAKDYKMAVTNFQKSLDLTPDTSIEKSRALSHLAEAQYLQGDQTQVEANLIRSLDILSQYQSQVDEYTFKVWQTGILMKLFVFTKDQKYFDSAKNIIDSDPKLSIRSRQLEELRTTTK